MIINDEFIAAYKIVAPFFKEFLGRDIMSSLTDRTHFIADFPADHINVICNPGEAIPDSDPSLKAMETGKQVIENVPAEIFGVPFKAVVTPLMNQQHRVIGSIALGLSLENEQQVVDLLVEILKSVEEITASTQQIAAAAANISEREQELQQKIISVDERVKNINSTTEQIRIISEQTRMLGFNAAIEAARAGDAGRGFAVVAEEIRHLSDTSQKTTRGIEVLTADIATYMNSLKNNASSNALACEEQAAVSEEISAKIQELTSMIAQVGEVAADM